MKKIVLGMTALIVMAGIFTFVSCDKEMPSNIQTSQGHPNAVKSSNQIILGENKDGEIICYVNLDEFSDTLWEQTNSYVAETFEILDSNNTAELHLVLYNIVVDDVESLWIPLQKTGNNYVFTASPSIAGSSVWCKIHEKCEKGCERKYKDNKFIGCLCSKSGSCEEVPLNKETIEMLIEALNKATANI